MEINRKTVEGEAQKLLRGKTWKEYLILSGISFVVVILLVSGLVQAALWIAKIIFTGIALFYLAKALFYGYPEWKKDWEKKD